VPVDEAKIQQDLPEFMKELRQSRQYSAFSDWLRNEMQTAKISLPGDEPAAAAVN
jgi:hypothetical protein